MMKDAILNSLFFFLHQNIEGGKLVNLRTPEKVS